MIKVVYCLTSTGEDIYEAMTRVSLATLRRTNPSANAVIACDTSTYANLQYHKSRLFSEADSIQSFHTPEGGPSFRSRFIKTQLGRLVDGPFLFLDCDTVVRGSLAPLAAMNVDVAAAPNKSGDTLDEQMNDQDLTLAPEFGSALHQPFVNSGVIFYGGSHASVSLANTWHQTWLANFNVTGLYYDQAPFNFCLNTIAGLNYSTLDHAYNFQYYFKSTSELILASKARIWHAYSSLDPYALDRFIFTCRQVFKAKPMQIRDRFIRGLVTSNSPFFGPTEYYYWRIKMSQKLLQVKRRVLKALHDVLPA